MLGHNPVQVAIVSPKPSRKPRTIDSVIASLSAQRDMVVASNAMPVDDLMRKPSRITELLGQGDLDPEEADRLRASLITMAAHTQRRLSLEGVGQFDGRQIQKIKQNVRAAASGHSNREWAVQIGAFSSETMSGQAIRVASKSLPPELRQTIKPKTVPLVTGSRTIYRARMGGFNEFEAQKACAYLKNCMVIAP